MKKFITDLYQAYRKRLYKVLSNNTYSGSPIINQPCLFVGVGKIEFNKNVMLGYWPSPFYYNGYIHLEARNTSANIKFGSNIFSNNNLVVICDKTLITICDNVLIGTNVEIYDSDFHEIHPDRRNSGFHKCAPVLIEENVFLGSNVKILKGVTVGKNSIIASNSTVVKSIPENVIAGGNPAKVIKSVYE